MRGLSSSSEDDEALIAENCRGACSLGDRVVTLFAEGNGGVKSVGDVVEDFWMGMKNVNGDVEDVSKNMKVVSKIMEGVIENMEGVSENMEGLIENADYVIENIEDVYKEAEDVVEDTDDSSGSEEEVSIYCDQIKIESENRIEETGGNMNKNLETKNIIEYTSDHENNFIEIARSEMEKMNYMEQNLASVIIKIEEAETGSIDEKENIAEVNGNVKIIEGLQDKNDSEEDNDKDTKEDHIKSPSPPPCDPGVPLLVPVCMVGLAIAIPLTIYLATRK